MKKIVIAGGSGYLGRLLGKALEQRGAEVVMLTRRAEDWRGPGRAVTWDGKTLGPWADELEGAQALINLAGRNVNCRPTAANARAILDSRVDSTLVLGEAIRQVAKAPKVWVQASSLAIYGDAGDRLCDEAAWVASGFPADVCVAWEEALGRALLPGIRWTALRIGFVLGREDGALPFLARLSRWGLGGRMGSGRQWMSWIHEDDMLAVFLRCLDDPSAEGVYNVTAPHPVPNAEFMAHLRDAVGCAFGPPVPAWALHAGAWLLGSDPRVALTGRRGIPARLEREGFSFRYPSLESALTSLFPKHQKPKQNHAKTCHEY